MAQGKRGTTDAEPTRVIRLNAETVRLVKVASAASGESMQAWLDGACRARLEREGKTAVGDRKRVASVRFIGGVNEG